jgi:transposase
MVGGEILSGPERRRRWSGAEKASIVAELSRPGARGAEIARRHGVSRSLLYAWRKAMRDDEHATAEMRFAPVVVAAPQVPIAPAGGGVIEIASNGTRVRLPETTSAATVVAVIKALRVGS